MADFSSVEGLAPPPNDNPDLQHWFAQIINAINSINMILEAQDGTLKEGVKIQLFAALDAEETDSIPKIILRTTHDIGTTSGNVTPDYDNGGHQKLTSSGNVSIQDVSNLPDGGWMDLYVDNSGGHTISFNASNFEGASLSFTDSTIVVSLVDFGNAKMVVVGGGF